MNIYRRSPELTSRRLGLVEEVKEHGPEYRAMIAQSTGELVLRTSLKDKILHPKRYFGQIRMFRRGARAYEAALATLEGTQKRGDGFIEEFGASSEASQPSDVNITEPELAPELQPDPSPSLPSPQSSDSLPPQSVSGQL